ncbi:MAG: xanthine dehydrogenase accessory protein XdhC [Pseudomonadota bacterium]
MSFDRADLQAKVAAHGQVWRVVVAATKGSVPREVGASMLVWRNGQSGTIGGGALELQAAQTALNLTKDTVTTHPLGPALGQCCGGAVTLLTEAYEQSRAESLAEGIFARGPGQKPLSVTRRLREIRDGRRKAEPEYLDGWMIEPESLPARALWIWGAGHVGRALVNTFAPLKRFEITWADTSLSRFPDSLPAGVTPTAARDLTQLIAYAPPQAEHVILTYSHEIDFALCHTLLNHGFGWCGLIGSATKWARFRSRLKKLGHSDDQIARITCPIGDPSLGKEPQAIALGLAYERLRASESVATHHHKEITV